MRFLLCVGLLLPAMGSSARADLVSHPDGPRSSTVCLGLNFCLDIQGFELLQFVSSDAEAQATLAAPGGVSLGASIFLRDPDAVFAHLSFALSGWGPGRSNNHPAIALTIVEKNGGGSSATFSTGSETTRFLARR